MLFDRSELGVPNLSWLRWTKCRSSI